MTTNVTVSLDNSYPSGAITSVKVYLPGARPSITCDSLVDTQASIKLPFSSLSSRWAPANSSPVVESTLLITTTGLSLGVFSIFTFVTLTSFFTVNVIVS